MKPQDLLVILKIFLWNEGSWSMSRLGASIGLSKSETHYSVKRCIDIGLLGEKTLYPKPTLIQECIEHAVKFMFPPKWGDNGVGIPTMHSTEPLSKKISSSSPLIVWPCDKGSLEGTILHPIYSSVPQACLQDKHIYEYFALIDSIRAGKARERKIALEELTLRIKERGVRYA